MPNLNFVTQNLSYGWLRTARKRAVVGMFLYCVLFFAFLFNGWIGDPSLHEITDHNGEAKLYGRLAKSEQDGVFSNYGFLGFCYETRGEFADKVTDTGPGNNLNQRTFYFSGVCPVFDPYRSQPGVMAIFLYAISKLHKSPLLLEAVASLVLATVILGWLYWLNIYSGTAGMGLSLIFFLLMRWFIAYGSNISLMIGFLYLPMVVNFWLIERRREERLLLATAVSATLCLLICGAEFLFAMILMSLLPPVFYGSLRPQIFRQTAMQWRQIALGLTVAGLLALMVLGTQLALDPDVDVFQYIRYTVTKRMHGDPEQFNPFYRKYLSMPLRTVLGLYLEVDVVKVLNRDITPLHLILGLTTWTLIFCFALKQGFVLINRHRRILKALTFTTWVSLLAPLSWIILCKGHAAAHLHMDPLVWHLPFGLLLAMLAAKILLLPFDGAKPR